MTKKLLQFYMIIFTIILSSSCFIYYTAAEDVEYYNKENKIEISKQKAFESVKDYDPNRFYYIRKVEKIKKTKTNIPFYYKKEVLEIKNYGWYSESQ